jgi:signal peptidase I
MTTNRAWTVSVVAGILLVVAVAVGLFGSGYHFYVVKTPSMGTTAPVGTLVAVHAKSSYAIGDVVSYQRNDRVYTHRIVEQTAEGFTTKGDSNDATDALTVTSDEIVGQVTFYGKYLGFLVEALPWILIGCAVVYVITLLPRIRPSWRWQIRFVGWSLVISSVALRLRPWVNLVMLGYAPSSDGGLDMGIVNTGIFPVDVVGTVLQSGQSAVVHLATADASGHYTVIPQLALNIWWFLLLLAICLTPMFASLLIPIDDGTPAAEPEPAPRSRRRVAGTVLIAAASIVLVAVVLQWSTQAAFAATITNSTNTTSTRKWFTCQNAETGTTGARFVWGLTATGTQNDLTGNGRSGTMTNSGTAATASSSSPCPRDTQGSVMFNGGTCVYTSGKVTGTETYSEEVWFQTTNASLNGKLMGFADVTTPASQLHYDRHIYIDPTGRVVFGVWPSKQTVVSSAAGKSYADGAWHHVVVTSAPGSIWLYLDGTLVSSRADTAGQDVYSGYWEVGCGLLKDWQDAAGTPRAFSSYYTGNLRLAAVYDVTLTATQVKEHYLAGTA